MMVGKYEIEVYNNRVHFYLEIRRNITIIQGDSATGKTTLIGLISDHDRLGSGSGVTVKCDKPCVALNIQDWKHFISSRNNHIIFIDENLPVLRSDEFAEEVASSDNYFVIVYRDSLPKLAYSIEEIYGMQENRDAQKYVQAKKVYNTLFQIYNPENRPLLPPDKVITEDTNAGFDFYNSTLKCQCLPAGGKSKVGDTVIRHSEEGKSLIAIVDGAAFGPDIERFTRSARNSKGNCLLYAPESFEYLILKSGIVEIDNDIIEHAYDYADSTKYLSWERFFSAKLSDITRNTIYQYSKLRLNKSYLTEGNVKRILNVLPEFMIEEDCKI